MQMDWSRLFQKQHELDERIRHEHRLTGDFLSERLLALHVEVSELANETRCFKYWSVKPPAAKEAILEEYVDGVHFILSLGLSLGFEMVTMNVVREKEQPIVEQFLDVYEQIAKLRVEKTKAAFYKLFTTYLLLGYSLGFTEQEIQQAYLAKNKLNHQRQDEGY